MLYFAESVGEIGSTPPSHPQSQGAVERLNGFVQEKLAIWIGEKNAKDGYIWRGATIGLESYVLPKSLVDAAKTKESTERFLSSQEEANKEESLKRHEKKYEQNKSTAEKNLPHQDQAFIKARKGSAAGQSVIAAKMTRRCIKMLMLHIGQNDTLRVPDVDRALADLKNFLVVPMAECKGLYTVVCREGKLPSYLQLLIYMFYEKIYH
ncbi:hypothetical protein T10_3820 [Trichinella papuae]|uniref:SCAN domain-containing protein 3 n=1 Tax=Trichinella papuae TaxID=268474 RepID=A0A0V1M1X9_9BILA|nr:hypothetical protein T10_3820 [Trichinella papuae]